MGIVAIASSLHAVVKAESCSTFEVASIKRNTSGAGGGYPELAPGGRRFTATNQLMIELIMSAYDVSPLQVSGIPKSFSGERYDIDATCDQPMTKEQIPQLLRILLAERFRLSVHHELREQPVYALIPDRGAPRLRESSSQQDGKPVLRQSGGHSFVFTNAAMSHLVGVLSQVTGRKVVDKSGLDGRYDFTLSYDPSPGGASVSAAADSLPESVFTAVREQLGLRLASQKSQVDFIVVDRLDRLIPN